MRKALIAAILVASIACVTAQAGPFPTNTLYMGGVVCNGQQNVVICYLQNGTGYRARISTNAVTVGVTGAVAGRPVIKKVLFTIKQTGSNPATVTPSKSGNMTYAGVYCEISWHTLGIMCTRTDVAGYGVEMDAHHVVVLNTTTGQIVFSKSMP